MRSLPPVDTSALCVITCVRTVPVSLLEGELRGDRAGTLLSGARLCPWCRAGTQWALGTISDN